jgi:hypothetical protein
MAPKTRLQAEASLAQISALIRKCKMESSTERPTCQVFSIILLFSFIFFPTELRPTSPYASGRRPSADHPHASCLPVDHPRVGHPPTDHPPAGHLTAAPTARAAHVWLHRPLHPSWWQRLRTCGHATALLVRLAHGGSASPELSHGEFQPWKMCSEPSQNGDYGA